MTPRANQLIKRASNAASELTTVPAGTVRVFVDALGKLGYDVESLLASAGVSQADLAGPDARISCAVLPQILGAAMQRRPMKNLGAKLASVTPIGSFPLVDYLVVTSGTVGAGLKQLARYLRLNETPFTLEPREEERPVRVLFDRPLNSFAVEFGVSLTVLHLRGETDGPLNITSVSFYHNPDEAGEIEQLLGCPVIANASWNGFCLTQEAWQMPMRRRDPVLRSVLEQHAAGVAAKVPEVDNLAQKVRRLLATSMVKGETQIEIVARALATSSRSLQRSLARDGLTFQRLLDDTRREAAGEYLSDPKLAIGEIAYLLGFSEAAAFHRAFKRWEGMTPQSFRDHLRGGHPKSREN